MEELETKQSSLNDWSETQNEQGQESTILESLNAVSVLKEPQALLEGMLNLILKTAKAGSAIYFRIDGEQNECVITAVVGDIESTHLLGLRLKNNEELLNPKTDVVGILTAGMLYSDRGWSHSASPGYDGHMQNLIILPVRTQQRSLGIIHLYNFQHGDFPVLQLLADRLALDLDQRDQLQEVQSHSRRVHQLLDAIGQMTGILDRNQLLYRVTEQASQLLDAERSTIFIVDPNTRETIYNVSYQTSLPTDPIQTDPHVHQEKPSQRKTGPLNYLTNGAISTPILNGVRNDENDTHLSNLGGLMVLNKRGDVFKQQDAEVLEILAEQASSLLQVAELYESSERLFLDAIRALEATIDAKDPSTQGHSARVSDYSTLIAQELELDGDQVNAIRISSQLHDIGKIGIPETILNKQGKLTEEERNIIQRHPIIGKNILRNVDMLSGIVPGIMEHHERLDGSGYPLGLSGDEISLMGRIITVADVFDAMTSSRPYRATLSVQETLDYLQCNVGKLFDGKCVQSLLNILNRSIHPENI